MMQVEQRLSFAGWRISALDWLTRLGLTRAVLAVTVLSVLLSLALTALQLRLVLAEPVPYAHWVFTAITVPAIVAPLVATMVFKLTFRLIETQAQLAAAARTDQLTGIGNRRAFLDVAERETARVARGARPFSLLIMDLDHFKTLNDRYGHSAGDEALVRVANICSGLLRRSDVLCRWGGEEFIALLPETDLANAIRVAEKLRCAVAQIDLPHSHRLTASIGVATATPYLRSLDPVIQEADRQLYLAKSSTRNVTLPALA